MATTTQTEGPADGTKLALLLMVTSLAVGQDDRIKIVISVTAHPENALVTQLGEDLKQEFLASTKYGLVSSQAEADVHFAIIGVGAESYVQDKARTHPNFPREGISKRARVLADAIQLANAAIHEAACRDRPASSKQHVGDDS